MTLVDLSLVLMLLASGGSNGLGPTTARALILHLQIRGSGAVH
jgi:hypothetical protein